MGLLTKLLVPFVYLILAATGVGLIVAPFIWVALLLCTIVGKVALLQWLGLKVGRNFGGGFQKPLAAFVLGAIIITQLYLVPVVGFLTYVILGVWGLGCGVTAAFARLRRETPDKPFPPAPPSASVPASPVAPPFIDPGAPPSTGATLESSVAPGTVPPIAPPVAPDVSSFPKANLWERLCAAFLDIILIAILSGIAHVGAFKLVIALAYFAGMWAWRGTTVGGIVLKLKVIGQTDGPLTFVGRARARTGGGFFRGHIFPGVPLDRLGQGQAGAGTIKSREPKSSGCRIRRRWWCFEPCRNFFFRQRKKLQCAHGSRWHRL